MTVVIRNIIASTGFGLENSRKATHFVLLKCNTQTHYTKRQVADIPHKL